MKKKSLRILALGLALSMSATVFAEETTLGEVEAGEVTNTAGPEEIPVYGTYSAGTPDGEIVISADVKWSSMQFTYAGVKKGAWDASEHKYEDDVNSTWLNDTADITLVNHSNTGITASLAFDKKVSTVEGTFDNEKVVLATAEETTVEEAPTEKVTFTIGGSMTESDTDLGQITVTFAEKVPEVLDLTGVDTTEYEAKIAAYVAKSETTNLKVALGTTSVSSTQGAALNTALGTAGVSELTVVDVTSVDDYGFGSMSNLVAISLPEVTSAGAGAFVLCQKLVSVEMPKLKTVSETYASTFSTCSSLQEVDLPELLNIGEAMFNGCDALKTVSIPKATSCGRDAFLGCTKLESVSLDSLLSISENMFLGCTSLTTISADSVLSIGSNAFQMCCAEELSFPKVTTVADNAFKGASSLKKVSLPSATSIGETIFASCPFVEAIEFGAVLESVGTDFGFRSNTYTQNNVILTLNANQGDVNGCTTTFGNFGTFNGNDFLVVKTASSES